MWFVDRRDAARRLAEVLAESDVCAALRRPLGGRAGMEEAPTVVGVPRGGVPVAAEVAARFGWPLGVMRVDERQVIGPPDGSAEPHLPGGSAEPYLPEGSAEPYLPGGSAEPYMPGGARPLGETGASGGARRAAGSPVHHAMSVVDRTVVLVDDGAATGSAAAAAIAILRELGARRVIVALPVASPKALGSLRELADDVLCLEAPERFVYVGQFYRDFRPVSDDEVTAVLASARLGRGKA